MEIEINRKDIKNLRIKVEDGIIKVSAPKRTSEREIKSIIKNNLDRIERLKEEDSYKKRYKNHLFGKKIEVKSEKEI